MGSSFAATAWRIGLWAGLASVAALAGSVVPATEPATGGGPVSWTVNTTADTNDGFCAPVVNGCTLREAIQAVGVGHTIRFSLPACPPSCTIQPTSELPAITDSGVMVDGSTQPGYSGEPLVTLDGTNAPSAQGLHALADDIVIRGIVVQNFPATGVHAATLTAFNGRRVENSIVRGNGHYGITLNGNNAAVVDSTIEGNGLAGIAANFSGAGAGLLVQGNEITGNGEEGVTSGFAETAIASNFISGNGREGVYVASDTWATAGGNTVTDNGGMGLFISGSTVHVTENTITRNGYHGAEVDGPGNVFDNVVTGNGAGPVPAGDVPGDGFVISGGGQTVLGNAVSENAGHGLHVSSSFNRIGGVEFPAQGNVVTLNGGSGVFVEEAGTIYNLIRGNSIHANGLMGIDNFAGGNQEINPPVILLGNTIGVVGTVDTPTCSGSPCTVDVYSDDADEGRVYEGSTVVQASGNWAFAGALEGPYITATVFDDGGNTSEFSEPLSIVVTTPTPSPSPTALPTPSSTASPTPIPTPTPTGTPTFTPTQPPGEQVEWGDHNCSGSSDPVDALLNLRHDAGLTAETNECPEMGEQVTVDGLPRLWGDLDCSGAADPVDGLKVLRFDAGLDVARPAGCPDPGEDVPLTLS